MNDSICLRIVLLRANFILPEGNIIWCVPTLLHLLFNLTPQKNPKPSGRFAKNYVNAFGLTYNTVCISKIHISDRK